MTNGVRILRNRRQVFNWLEKFIAIFAFTVLVCSEANALERIRIGLSVRNVVFLPFYYAQERALYEKYGLRAELIQMRSDLQTVGLVSGEIDFTPVIGPAVSAIAMAEMFDSYVNTVEDRDLVLKGARESMAIDRAYRGALAYYMSDIQ